jgi:hypothetical protein
MRWRLERPEARAKQLRVDRELLARLEAVRGERSEHMDPKRSDADYADAFRKAGLDLDMVSPAEAGKRISGRSDPAELVSYLDDWALMRRSASAEPSWRRLVEAPAVRPEGRPGGQRDSSSLAGGSRPERRPRCQSLGQVAG